ncbi:MAG TPA: tetratricopeptide repeat protein [Fibrobacteria bacterium]|nr:tetratricopeptide repeat protein [Fibrobacteria bacterium]
MSAQMGSPEELLGLGESALAQSRWQDAADLFKRAHDADPSGWRAIQGLSISLFWLGRRDDAWVLAQEAYRRCPSDPDNEANLRDIASALGCDDQLGRILSEASGAPAPTAPTEPVQAAADGSTCACDIGERLLESEQWNDSLPYFLKAIDEDAGQSRAWGGIGISCYRQGLGNAARAFFEMAVRMDPADSDSVFNWTELAPAGTSDRDLAMLLDSMGVGRELREKAIEARRG